MGSQSSKGPAFRSHRAFAVLVLVAAKGRHYGTCGTVVAIINPPNREGLAGVIFGGPNMQWLHVTDGDKMYRRQVKRQGAVVWNAVKPPRPRL